MGDPARAVKGKAKRSRLALGWRLALTTKGRFKLGREERAAILQRPPIGSCRRAARSGSGCDDLSHQLAQVVVGLVDHLLP
jgi:hypothetical protein